VVFGAGAIEHLSAELGALSILRSSADAPGRARALPACAGARRRRGRVRSGGAARAGRSWRRRRPPDRVGPDAVVAVGGGSAIGLAKAIALERPRPIVAVPTTMPDRR
jgi:maleylacetate reductase